MNELNCEYVRDVYPDVLNNTAPPETAAAVRAHLLACDECRDEVEAVNAIFAGAVVAPPQLHAAVMAGIALPVRAEGRISWRHAALAATVAAAVLGASLLFRINNHEPAPPVVSELDAAALGAVTVEAALVSGKESLQDLTVEELEQLLGEIES